MEYLHDACEATKHEAHNTENHDRDVLPEDPVPFTESVIPESNNLNDRWEDERQSAAADGSDKRNDCTKVGDHCG